MPPRTFARRRRNPTFAAMRETLYAEFFEALLLEGARAIKDISRSEEEAYLPFGSKKVVLPKKRGAFWVNAEMLFTARYDHPWSALRVFEVVSIEDDTDPAEVARLMARAAERTGALVGMTDTPSNLLGSGFLRAANSYGGDIIGLYVPQRVSNRETVARAYGGGDAPLFLSRMSLAERTEILAHALTENHFPGVPEEYREQVARLFLSALENDDVSEYLYAREVASMVAE